MAMLARQGWRMLQNPESLCARVLGAKYFPDGKLLNAREISNMSYTWRSILKGIVILKKKASFGGWEMAVYQYMDKPVDP